MSEEEIILHCPKCSEHDIPKLYVNVSKGVFNCFRCGFAGSIKQLHRYPSLLSKLEDSLDLSERKKLNSFKPLEVSSFNILEDLNPVREILYSDPQYNYLLQRGWTEDTIVTYRPLLSLNKKYLDRVILPIFDNKLNLIYFTARSIDPNTKIRYINANVPKSDIVFKSSIPENMLYSKIGVIVEGIFDGAKIPNSLGLLGKILTKENEKNVLDFISNKEAIYVCLDAGAEKDTNLICHKLSSWAPNKRIYYINTEAYGNDDLGDLSKTMSPHTLLRFIRENSILYEEHPLSTSLKSKFSLLAMRC